ncbi:MAG TPA: MFS transporter, partial [Nitrososphaera sp.]|nr:MFS transporter [Nitrososphaera sp.]
PYTPFLKDSGISDSQVFLAYTILHLCKVVFLPFNHRIIALKGEEGMSKIAYVPRITGLALAVVAAMLVIANPGSILMITLLAFVGTEVGFSMWSATTTSSLLKIIPAGQEGRILGINSAVVGAGLLVGSIAAGEVSAAFGYSVTFALAIVVAGASFVLVGKFFKKTKVAPQVQRA